MDEGSASLILIVTGLSAEARIAAGPGCLVLAGGGDGAGLARQLAQHDPIALTAIVSFGLAGGLAPDLPVGAIVLATDICTADPPDRSPRRKPGASPGDGVPAYAGMSGAEGLIAGILERTGIAFRRGPIVGVDAPATTVAEKAALHAATGAGAVDMESHIAAAYAAGRGLPFVAIRVISDGAAHVVPPAAATAMRPDGSVDVWGLLRALARDPGQIPALVATARNAAVAFRMLRRVRGLLGPNLGLHF